MQAETEYLMDARTEVLLQIGVSLLGSNENQLISRVDKMLSDQMGATAKAEALTRYSVCDSRHLISLCLTSQSHFPAS